MALTGGQAVVAALEAEGIEVAFTVPGESFLEVLDALRDSPIRVIATRHEGGAAFMAEGYGQLTGRPAVCLGTRAVGAANLAIGLHTARQDSTPLVALCGQIPTAYRGREAFQEADLQGTFGDAWCKEAIEIDRTTDLYREVRRLVRVATSGRPGPVLASLPEDVLESRAGPPVDDLPPVPVADAPAADEVGSFVRALATARSPVILAGAGILRSRSRDGLVRFAEATQVPVITSWRRPDAFPVDHPLALGMAGLAAPPAVRERLLAADVLLALGTRLGEPTTFGYAVPAPGTRLLRVDLAVGPWPAAERSLACDVATFLGAALRLPAPALGPVDAPARSGRNVEDRARFVAASRLPPLEPGAGVHPGAAVPALQRLLPPDAVLTTDAGNFASWPARYLRLPPGARFLGPTSGAMGYALPAAIGAAVAEPARRAVALAGDGGFAMLMAELETAARLGARVCTVVFDNAMYGTIRMHQERAHPGRVVATDLGRIDAAAVARACGVPAWTVHDDAEVEPALREALRVDGPSLVHLLTDPRVLSLDERLP